MQVYAAVPEGSKRARNQQTALRALEARIALEADLGHLRADSETNARTIARAVVYAADWRTLVLWPGWETLKKRTRLGRTSIAKYLALFHSWGLLGRVRAGSTHRTRGHKQGDTDANLAGEYVLCVPSSEPVEETRTPSLLRKEERSTGCESSTRTRTRARETATWPIHQTPRTRGEQRQAARRLRSQEPALRRLSAKQLTDILEPVFTRGWDLAQVRHALNHTPDGNHHWHSDDVRHPAGWLKHRLELWDGATPPRQLGAGRSTDLEPADVTRLPAAGERSTADVEGHASLARRLLAATKRRGDKTTARRGLGVSLPDRDGRLTPAVGAETVAGFSAAAGDGGWLLVAAAKRASA